MYKLEVEGIERARDSEHSKHLHPDVVKKYLLRTILSGSGRGEPIKTGGKDSDMKRIVPGGVHPSVQMKLLELEEAIKVAGMPKADGPTQNDCNVIIYHSSMTVRAKGLKSR